MILSDDGNSQSLAKKITIRIADLNNEFQIELTSAVFEALEVKLTTANLRFGVATRQHNNRSSSSFERPQRETSKDFFYCFTDE